MASRSANNVRASTTPGPGVTLRTLCPSRLKAGARLQLMQPMFTVIRFRPAERSAGSGGSAPGVRLFRHLFKAFLQRQHFVPLVRQIGVAGAFLLHYGGWRAADEALVGKFFG